VKAFDMVHARIPKKGPIEIWLGESKLYAEGLRAIADAITSIRAHVDAGFLSNEKLLLGPQIPKTTPRYAEISAMFKKQASLDLLLNNAVFAVGILCNSISAKQAKERDEKYMKGAIAELAALAKALGNSGLAAQLRLVLIYVPLASKKELVEAFDSRLKGLQ
jgi:hypothetical protein